MSHVILARVREFTYACLYVCLYSSHLQYLFTNGWVHKDGILDDDGEVVEHAGSPWVSSFYWAVTTMSTIGYGDISPGTEPERVLAMFLMAAGCSFFAWVTGKITQLLTQRPACEDRFESIIGDLEAFMNARMIPPILRNKIRNYYKVNCHRRWCCSLVLSLTRSSSPPNPTPLSLPVPLLFPSNLTCTPAPSGALPVQEGV